MPAPIKAALLLSPISAPRPAPTAAPAPAPAAVRPPVLIPPIVSSMAAHPATREAANTHAATRFNCIDTFIFSSPCHTIDNTLPARPMLARPPPCKCNDLIRCGKAARPNAASLPPIGQQWRLRFGSFLTKIQVKRSEEHTSELQ